MFLLIKFSTVFWSFSLLHVFLLALHRSQPFPKGQFPELMPGVPSMKTVAPYHVFLELSIFKRDLKKCI